MEKYRIYGKKSCKIVVVHGGPGAPGSVAPVAREISKKYEVLEPFQTKTTLEEQLRELYEQITETCEGKVIMIGHSWGAWLSYIFTYRFSEKVEKLILVGSGPFKSEYASEINKTRVSHLTDDEGKEYLDILKKLNEGTEEDINVLVSRLGVLAEKSDTYCSIEDLEDKNDLIEADGMIYQAVWGEAAALRTNGKLLEMTNKIKCEVVVIHGDYDPHPADGVKVPLSEKIDKFKFYLIEKCGHYPWKEKYAKEEFYRILFKESEK